jgi:Ribbon-helix-helix protein, copG family
MIKSLRIDPPLAARVQRAARMRGITESEFMREAIEGRTREALEDDESSFYERTRHLILPPSDTEIPVTTVNVGDVIAEKHARIVDGYRRRRGARRDPAAG